MKFVCSFAWTDLKIQDEEKELIEKMIDTDEFDQADRMQVSEWLQVPPPAGDVDPTQIPAAHRQQFLAAVRAVVSADGRVVPAERDSLELFEGLLEY